MLADLTLEVGGEEFAQAWGRPMWGEFSRVLKSAQKFNLDRSMGEVLGEMPRAQVRTALPFCRLPFPHVWLEIAQADRPAFTRRPVAEGLYQPVRVGVLCEQAGDDPCEFFASLVWSFTAADAARQGGGLGGSLVNISSGALYVNTQLEHVYEANSQYPETREPFTATPLVSRYFQGFLEEVAAKQPELVEFFRHAVNNDWQGEIWFWLSALAMLNARNGARSIPRPAAPKLNNARVKRGKPALMDFHELTLRLSPGEARAEREYHGRAASHAHVVRGHFKVRATGVYWWRPHIRGDLAEGFTDKRYKLKA